MGTCEDLGETLSLSCLVERNKQPTCTNNAQAHVMTQLYLYTSLKPVKCLTLPQKFCQDCKYWFCVSLPSHTGT